MREEFLPNAEGMKKETAGILFLRKVFGMLTEASGMPYPCVPQPGAGSDEAGVYTVVTASCGFRVPCGDAKKTEITPVLYQSCMHPEQIHIDTVRILAGNGEICFLVRDCLWKIPEREADAVEIFPWKAELKKKSCIPCTNCGGCSW